jgi:2'-5' RNA ligase
VTQRLFIAVDPPAAAVAHLGAVVDGLAVARANRPGHSTRLADRSQWHVTLTFLGDVDDDRVGAVSRAVEAAVGAGAQTGAGGARTGAGGARTGESGAKAESEVKGEVKAGAGGVREPIALRIAGGGTFGRGGRTILWVAIGGDLPAMRTLVAGIRSGLRRERVTFDRKPWRPHLTISRPGERVSAADIELDLATLRTYEGPLWTVDAVHVMRSEMEQTPTGPRPRYTRVSSTPLPT